MMVNNPTTLGHHEMEAEVKDEPARRKRSAEQVVSGASADAIAAFAAMQKQARDADATGDSQDAPSLWNRLLRRLSRRK